MTNTKPIEPALAYFRQSAPGAVIELVISLDGRSPHTVYVMRPSLMGGLLRDGLNFFLRSLAPTSWEQMWARKFDHPERI